jgi:RHS repeat-associated protein
MRRLYAFSVHCVLSVCLLWATPCFAQSEMSMGDAGANKGLHAERNYFSPESFEHFDTLSGNLVLTFTDLVLPGNAGRTLRIQRTYNNQAATQFGPTTGSPPTRWTFGLAGMVTSIVERTVSQGNAGSTVEQMAMTTPILIMADGSQHRTMYVSNPAAPGAIPESMEVVSAGFIKYHRQNRTAQYPDGTVAHYDATTGRLLWFHDQYDNTVELSWSSTELLITQHVGNQERQISLDLDELGRVTAMHYEDRDWSYEYVDVGTQEQPQKDISRVVLPEGQEWLFSYDTATQPPIRYNEPFYHSGWYEWNGLASITTPHKGVIRYDYAEKEIYEPYPVDLTEIRRTIVARHSEGPRGTVGGTWLIELFASPDHGQIGRYYSFATEIFTPTGGRVVYWHTGTTSTNPANVLTGGISIGDRFVYSGEVLLEQTRTEYTDLSLLYLAIVPRVKKVSVTRDGRTYTKTYAYGSANFGDFHNPTSLTEVGTNTRVTTYTYSHLTTPWITALPLSEQRAEPGSGQATLKRRWTYNALGFKTSDVDWYQTTQSAGVVTTYTPDARGNVVSQSVSGRPATTFTYDWGRVKDTVTPAYTVFRQINTDGTVASETIAERTTSFGYDDMMRPTLITPPGGAPATITEYDNVEGASIVVRNGASVVTTTLDGFGRQIATVDSQGVRTANEYDAEGRLRFQTRPFDITHAEAWSETQYDAIDRITAEINPDGTARLRTYGNSLVIVQDEAGHLTQMQMATFGHPADARIAVLTDAALQAWTYSYTVLGAIAKVVTPSGAQRVWQYDALNRLVQQVQPESGTTVFTYDSAAKHLVKTRKDANNKTFTNTYDTNDRVTKVASSTSSYVQTRYEIGSNNIEALSTESVSTVFSYDSANRIRSRNDTVGTEVFNSIFTYDVNGNVAKVTYPSGREVSYEYDSERRIQRVFELEASRDYATGISYHPTGVLEGYVAGNGTTTLIERDPLRNWVAAITSGPLALSYSDYDEVGNVRTLSDARPGYNQQFDYDALDRLRLADGPYGSVLYQYDAHGNRTSANGTTYTYHPTTLRVSSQGGTPFTYDNNGNTLTAGGATYTYTPMNMLATAQASGNSVAFTYDGQNQRMRKTVGTLKTYSIRGPRGELLGEFDQTPTGGVWRDYVYVGSHLLAAVSRDDVPMGTEKVIDFESGESLGALGFTRIIDVSSQAGEGLGGSGWGARGNPGASDSKKYYGEASLPVVSTTREFEFEADFDHADSGYSMYGFSAFEMRLQTDTNYAVWFFSLYHGYGDTPGDRSQLVLYGLTPDELYSAPGVIIPGTTQRITVRGTLSTINNYQVNADGAVQVLVDGVVIFDVANVELGWNYFGPAAVENGIALWDRLMIGPMGRFDNLRVDAGGPGVLAPDTVQYYHSDSIGSVRAITDATGGVVDRLDYLPFGERWNPGTTNERREFAGRQFDLETGLDYFGARYYAGSTGRFTSVDPLGSSGRMTNPQTFNRYAYALNNPLRHIDPWGLEVSADCANKADCKIEVKVNVVFDKALKLSPEQKATLEREQLRRAQETYKTSNIHLTFEYSPVEQDVALRGGTLHVDNLDPKALNVVFTNRTVKSKVTVVNGTAIAYVNPWTRMDVLPWSDTTHEMAHHFLGHAAGGRNALNYYPYEIEAYAKVAAQAAGKSISSFRTGLQPHVYASPLTTTPKP